MRICELSQGIKTDLHEQTEEMHKKEIGLSQWTVHDVQDKGILWI